eukprot:2083084-Prymnesium_polylepis.1
MRRAANTPKPPSLAETRHGLPCAARSRVPDSANEAGRASASTRAWAICSAAPRAGLLFSRSARGPSVQQEARPPTNDGRLLEYGYSHHLHVEPSYE